MKHTHDLKQSYITLRVLLPGVGFTSSWWRHQMETFSALLALCVGNHRSPLNSPHKGQWLGALMFSLIYAWTNDWANNRDAGHLRRHRIHDVTVMLRRVSLVCLVFTIKTLFLYLISRSFSKWENQREAPSPNIKWTTKGWLEMPWRHPDTILSATAMLWWWLFHISWWWLFHIPQFNRCCTIIITNRFEKCAHGVGKT